MSSNICWIQREDLLAGPDRRWKTFHSFTSCNTMNLRDLCAHPALIRFLSPVTTYLWISCFSIFRSQSVEFTTCQHPWISVTSYFQTSSKDILLSVSLPHFSCPPCLEYLCPRALILLRLWRYINHVLTYLLTYLVRVREGNGKATVSEFRLCSYSSIAALVMPDRRCFLLESVLKCARSERLWDSPVVGYYVYVQLYANATKVV